MPTRRPVTVALVSRMLRGKGVLDAVAAIRLLAARPAGRTAARRPAGSGQSRFADAGGTVVACRRAGHRLARPRRGCSRGLAARGDRRAALDLWRRRAEGVARSRRLRAADHRQRYSRLPRGGAPRRDRPAGAAARCRGAGRGDRRARRRSGAAAKRWGEAGTRTGRARLRRGDRRRADPGALSTSRSRERAARR